MKRRILLYSYIFFFIAFFLGLIFFNDYSVMRSLLVSLVTTAFYYLVMKYVFKESIDVQKDV